ncbi:MAG: acyl-CoA dehydrogenase family protein [Planctomycetota bacterium]
METFYELTAEQAAIVDRAKKIAKDVIEKESAAADRDRKFPRAAMKALGEAGLLGLTLPKKLGGLEQGPRVFAAVVETIARACPSTGMVYVMHVCAANVVAGAPSQEKLARDIAAGKHVTPLAFSEKGSRSHFWAPVSKEGAKNGKKTLSAEKSFVTSAGEADSYVTSTLAADAKDAVTSTLWLVANGAKGVAVEGAFDGLGLRGNASAPMSLRDVEVADDARLTEPGQGFGAMMSVVLPWFQVGSAACSVGIGEAAFAITAAHLGKAKLEHMGAALNTLPNLRANVARMRIELDRSRAQLAYTARAMEKPGDHTMPAVLSAKAQAAEMSLVVTDLGMRSCGGAAFSKAMPLERFFRDARASAVMAPTTDALHDFLGKALLGLPLF